jgi:hypothetical protein
MPMTGFWGRLFAQVLGAQVGALAGSLKVQAAILYVNLIKSTRRMAMLLCLLVLCAIVIACGFLLIPVALCLFMPWGNETKALVAASFGAAYVVIPLIVAVSLFSQKRWMRVSRAGKLLRAALRQ